MLPENRRGASSEAEGGGGGGGTGGGGIGGAAPLGVHRPAPSFSKMTVVVIDRRRGDTTSPRAAFPREQPDEEVEMTHTIRCKGCSVSVPAGQVQLDGEGRALCRKCTALAFTAMTNDAERAAGRRRKCRRCRGFTLVRGEAFEPVALSVYGPGFERSMPIAVAHAFRCDFCRSSVFLLSAAGIALLAIFSLIVAFALVNEVGESWLLPLFNLPFLLVVLREVIVRRRHPTS